MQHYIYSDSLLTAVHRAIRTPRLLTLYIESLKEIACATVLCHIYICMYMAALYLCVRQFSVTYIYVCICVYMYVCMYVYVSVIMNNDNVRTIYGAPLYD
jgi:hypothetical protein